MTTILDCDEARRLVNEAVSREKKIEKKKNMGVALAAAVEKIDSRIRDTCSKKRSSVQIGLLWLFTVELIAKSGLDETDIHDLSRKLQKNLIKRNFQVTISQISFDISWN
jgi:hypothetical protein